MSRDIHLLIARAGLGCQKALYIFNSVRFIGSNILITSPFISGSDVWKLASDR